MFESPYLLKRRSQKQGLTAKAGKKIPASLPLKSSKMKIDDNEYKKLVKEMLAENPYCELKVPGVCTGMANGLHHMARRGKLLLVKKFLKRACNACNNWCELHPLEALEKRLSLSVHKKEGTGVVVLIDAGLKTIVVESSESINKKP